MRSFEISTEIRSRLVALKIRLFTRLIRNFEITFLKWGGETAFTDLALKYMPSGV